MTISLVGFIFVILYVVDNYLIDEWLYLVFIVFLVVILIQVVGLSYWMNTNVSRFIQSKNPEWRQRGIYVDGHPTMLLNIYKFNIDFRPANSYELDPLTSRFIN
jgi:uncharacterized membrane protein YcgQ (UPF0703/DUF1980 family)